MSKRQLSAELRHAKPLFAALGDNTRLYLVGRLCVGGPLSITRLAEGTRISRQAVTKHLHVLKGAGLVKGARSGREQIWELNPESIQAARRYLDSISRQWSEALGRLKAFVEDERG